MTAKKSSAPGSPPHPRKNTSTIEVDPAWLEPPADDEKARSEHTPAARPRSAATGAIHKTIPVQSAWLMPPLPRETADQPAGKPPRPAALAVKPRGKLPPALPREDRDDESEKRRSKHPRRS